MLNNSRVTGSAALNTSCTGTTDDPIDICGFVVLVQPDYIHAVRSQLEHIAGLIIHAGDARGRMAVTIENQPNQRQSIPARLDQIRALTGILDVSLAYSHCESITNQ